MLSIVPIKNAGEAVSYYTENDNYYAKDSAEAKEASHWYGKGAEQLGLSGHIEVNAFKELLEGKLPSGQQLGRMTQEGVKHRPGYDLTFSAPKSFSILAEVCAEKRLYALHDKAVNMALNYLEKHAAQTRVGENGNVVFEQTDNLVIGKVRHGASRENDPQTHTHCVVMNMTQRNNGQWHSLSSEQFFDMQLLAGVIYRTVLAYKLKELGYGIDKTHADGRFEIAGVPNELIQHYSKRSQQVKAALEKLGKEGSKAAELATLSTRVKKEEIDPTILRAQWREEATNLGIDIEKLPSALITLESFEQKDLSELANIAVYYGIQHLSERESVFSQHDLLRHSVAYSLGNVLPNQLETTIQKVHEEKQLIRRFDLDGHYWTTPKAIKLEKETIGFMLQGRYSVARMDTIENIQESLAAHSHLNASQRQAVQHILTTPDRILGVQGYAGVGKTTMLKAVKDLAETKGFILHGLAPSAVAAQQLQNESGIESQTLSKFLSEQQATEMNLGQISAKDQYQATHVYVVDESSMISTKQMHELLKAIHSIGARAILVGDKKQLGAVQAGKPFYELQQGGMSTYEMKTILRQKDNPELLTTVHSIIAGNIKKALDKIGGNLIEIPNKNLRLTAMVNEYLVLDQSQREKTLLLTSTNQDRQVLNQQIREGLKKEGVLSDKSLTTTVLINRDLTQAQRVNASQYLVGDTIRFNHAYQKLGVKKGEYIEVINIDAKTNAVTLKNAKGKTMEWQPHQIAGKRAGALEVYQTQSRELVLGDTIRWARNDGAGGLLNATQAKITAIKDNKVTLQLKNGQFKTININDMKAKHWDYAYAMTAHGAQGLTADRVIAQGESYQKNLTNQQSFYVIMSRAKFEVKVFTDDKEQYLKTLEKHTGEKSSALNLEQMKEINDACVINNNSEKFKINSPQEIYELSF